MHRIDTATKSVDKFGAGKHGFNDGNKATTVAATQLNAGWCDALQEEIAAVIEGAGMALDAGTNNQLKSAIQSMIDGGDYKPSCRVATTANLAALSGLLTIDGVTLVANDRVLVKDQTTGSQNGIYIAAAGAWSRSTDADGTGDLTASALFPVEEGTINADTVWMLTNNGAITIGTTALVFSQKASLLASSAEVLAGTNASKGVTSAALLAGLLGAGGSGTGDYVTIPYRDKSDGSRKNLIIQWGHTSNFPADATLYYTYFPIAFPNACLSVTVTNNADWLSTAVLKIRTLAPTNFEASQTQVYGSASTHSYFYIAIGY
jgi:hypothetical protein